MTAATSEGFTDVRPPLVGAETWRQVVDRAGERCECRGQCGRRHADRANPDAEPHCPHFNGQRSKPLHVVPRTHLTSATTQPGGGSGRFGWSRSARLTVGELAAVCEGCHAGIDAARTAQARAAAEPPPALF